MINLRYHIVSITAVFLALGIGIALGSTLIERATVDTLNDRLDSQAERLDRTDGENARLREELQENEDFAAQLMLEGPALFAGHLSDLPVVVLTVQGTDDELVSLTRGSLRAAGAEVTGVLRVTSRWEDLTAEEVTELGELVGGRQVTNPNVARSLALQALASELRAAAAPAPATGPPEVSDPSNSEEQSEGVEGPEPADTAPESTTNGAALALLIEHGYLEFLSDTTNVPLPTADARYVLVVDEHHAVNHEIVLVPLLRNLATADPSPLLVASPLLEPDEDRDDGGNDQPHPGPLVTTIRSTPRLGAAVATVDDARRFVGQAAIVLGLADLLGPTPRVGHYGAGDDATALMPPVEGA